MSQPPITTTATAPNEYDGLFGCVSLVILVTVMLIIGFVTMSSGEVNAEVVSLYASPLPCAVLRTNGHNWTAIISSKDFSSLEIGKTYLVSYRKFILTKAGFPDGVVMEEKP